MGDMPCCSGENKPEEKKAKKKPKKGPSE